MTRDAVLAILRSGRGYVSGERISEQLNVSRAAVSAAVKSLREDGYEIDSVTNRGYELRSSPDRLSAGELLALLPCERMKTVACLRSVGSTSDFLRSLAEQGAPEGQVVMADEQTGGRGRMGRRFESPAGRGIYLSMLLRPDGRPEDLTAVTGRTAVSVSDAIENLSGKRPDIKWVNDLLMNGRKICGILTEMSVEGESGHVQFVIVGIGVNVNETETEFPPELRGRAGSIRMAAGKPVRRAALAAEIIRRLDTQRLCPMEENGYYLQAYRKACLTQKREVLLLSAEAETRVFAEQIDESFGLVVRMPDGSRKIIRSGEVGVSGLC